MNDERVHGFIQTFHFDQMIRLDKIYFIWARTRVYVFASGESTQQTAVNNPNARIKYQNEHRHTTTE